MLLHFRYYYIQNILIHIIISSQRCDIGFVKLFQFLLNFWWPDYIYKFSNEKIFEHNSFFGILVTFRGKRNWCTFAKTFHDYFVEPTNLWWFSPHNWIIRSLHLSIKRYAKVYFLLVSFVFYFVDSYFQ